MEDEYVFQGETVEEVYESYQGSYWIVTDSNGAGVPFGYVSLSGMRQFAEWGHINPEIFSEPDVWEVPRENWAFTGPESIDIQRADE